MPRTRPARLRDIAGIGVDRMGSIADTSSADLLRLENLDCDIEPDPAALQITKEVAAQDKANSYLPFVGQTRLRNVVAQHVTSLSGVDYSGERNVLICAGGLSGILNVLLATVEVGDEVILTDLTYAGLINRVRLAGGIPKFAPLRFNPGKEWALDLDALRSSITPKTRGMLLMSPSMPTGAYLTAEDWDVVAELCVTHDLLLILDTAMERLLFDGRQVIHPAGLPGMSTRTVTVGSCSKELRMIGWRVGWIVAPEDLIPDLTAVGLANVVTPVGIAQAAVAVALERSRAPAAMATWTKELQSRRDVLTKELRGLPFGMPAGGWSLVLRVDGFGLDEEEAEKRLLERGICCTGMRGWGEGREEQGRFVRFVFSNEGVERLGGIGEKVRAALGVK